jgi:uncharacterized protein involved in exopolysaccharide biosynthesis
MNDVAEEIDLKAMFQVFWINRKWIVIATLVCWAIAATYAYLIAKPAYTSTALLLPTQASSGDQLSAAAALLGKGAGGTGDVELYQGLLTSRTVMFKLIHSPVRDLSDSGVARIAPLYALLRLDSTKPISMSNGALGLAKSIVVGSKQTGAGGILEVRTTASSPWLAQEIGNLVLEIGQEEIRQVRVKRSDIVLARLAVAVKMAKDEWDSAARNLTNYRDRNRSITVPEQMLALSRLEIDKQAKEQKYLLARHEFELQILEKAKATPPMMILDSADLPLSKSYPKRVLIMAVGIALGIAGGCVSVLIWKMFLKSEA